MWVEITRAALLTTCALLLVGFGWGIVHALSRLRDDLVSALKDVAEASTDPGAPPDIVAQLESLERRITDAVDVTERRYRAIIQRERRGSGAVPLPGDEEEAAPTTPAQLPERSRPRLVRKHGR